METAMAPQGTSELFGNIKTQIAASGEHQIPRHQPQQIQQEPIIPVQKGNKWNVRLKKKIVVKRRHRRSTSFFSWLFNNKEL